VEWREADNHVLMTGPVQFEYEGRFPAALFANTPSQPSPASGGGKGGGHG